jgi:hypothetical protein
MMYADEGDHPDNQNPHHYSHEDHDEEEEDDNIAGGVSGHRHGGH